jgi:hypothetical protein
VRKIGERAGGQTRSRRRQWRIDQYAFVVDLGINHCDFSFNLGQRCQTLVQLAHRRDVLLGVLVQQRAQLRGVLPVNAVSGAN